MTVAKNGAKSWRKSKTVWFNILTIGGAVLSGVVALLPAIEMLISPATYAITLFVIGAINVVLRAITTGPIQWEEENDESVSSKP